MTDSFTKFIPSQNKKNELLFALTGPAREYTFGQFLEDAAADPAKMADHLKAFHALSVEDIMSYVPDSKSKTTKTKTKEKKAEKTTTEIPGLKNPKDEAELAAYQDQILAVITEHGLGDGPSGGRGIGPAAIRTKIGRGTPDEAKDRLTELVKSGAIVATGATRGLRYVVATLGDQARAKEAEEIAARDAKKSKAE